MGNETIENFISANNLATGSTNLGVTNIGLAPYNNSVASSNWNYQNTNSVGTLNSGQGYSVKLAAIGDIAFSGTLNATNQTQTITQSVNDFNLVGNPFAAYLNLGDFFTDNATSGILSEATAWFWDQNTNTYEPKTANLDGAFEIPPAQGFFLSAGNSSSTVTFDVADLSHQNTDAFQKIADTRPQIQLNIKDGTNNRSTRVFYIEGTTTGFDNGYDGTLFGGSTNALQVYSQLVTNDNDVKLGVQVLPNSGYEEMIIPIGVTASAGKEVSFYAESLNLPSGVKLYLEDRFTNTFVLLETQTDEFKVNLTERLDGVGRFYLHTSSNVLSTNENLSLASIQVFKSGSKTLKLVGLPNGTSDLKLYTMQGKEVFKSSFKDSVIKEISLADLATGVYLIQLETIYGKLNRKIVLN